MISAQFVPIISALPPTARVNRFAPIRISKSVIRKLQSGKYRLYSRKKDPKTGRRRNLGTFSTRAAAAKHEREVQYFKKA